MSVKGSIQGLVAVYPDSSSDFIVTNLSSEIDRLMDYYVPIAFTCMLISIGIRLINSFRNKESIVMGDIFVHIAIISIGFVIWDAFFLTTTNLFNMLADAIMPTTDVELFFSSLKEGADSRGEFSLMDLNIPQMLSGFVGFLSLLFAAGLFVARKIILAIIYVFAPLALALSPLPMFGLGHIKTILQTMIQVQAWVVIHSGFLLIMTKMMAGTETNNLDGYLEWLLYTSSLLVVSVIVPSMAQIIFGGSNMLSIPAAINYASKKLDNKARSLGLGAAKGMMGVGGMGLGLSGKFVDSLLDKAYSQAAQPSEQNIPKGPGTIC